MPRKPSKRMWNTRLNWEGLGMGAGRLGLPVDPRILEGAYEDSRTFSGLAPRGLVSPLWSLAPSGSNISEEERNRRARVALKAVVRKHGHAEVETRLRGAAVSQDDEPARVRLLSILATLPA